MQTINQLKQFKIKHIFCILHSNMQTINQLKQFKINIFFVYYIATCRHRQVQ